MIDEIRATAQMTSLALDTEALDPRVLQAMAKVPRHTLVPEAQLDAAYENRPLPIGHGQTISQPYIVALMTDLLKSTPEHRVLEIGTGSGYQAAVLAELVDRVYSIEIIEPLGEQARRRLAGMGYENVEVRIGVPRPDEVDREAVLSVLPYGTATIEVIEGGLEIPHEGRSDATLIAHAATIVRLEMA